MKKYITIAALLAAGTAFANAITGEAANTKISEDLTLKKYEVGDAFKVELSLYVQNNMDAHTGFLKFANDGWIVNQAHSYWGINTTDSNSITETTGVYDKKIDGKNYTYTASSISPLWAQNTTLTGSETRGSVWTANCDLSVTIGTDGEDSWVTLSYGTASDIVDNWIFNDVVLNANDIVLDNNLSVTSCDVSVSSIPEPSAFGLLAGIGALALVASRRRRK